jgi:hypothetical protein
VKASIVTSNARTPGGQFVRTPRRYLAILTTAKGRTGLALSNALYLGSVEGGRAFTFGLVSAFTAC